MSPLLFLFLFLSFPIIRSAAAAAQTDTNRRQLVTICLSLFFSFPGLHPCPKTARRPSITQKKRCRSVYPRSVKREHKLPFPKVISFAEVECTMTYISLQNSAELSTQGAKRTFGESKKAKHLGFCLLLGKVISRHWSVSFLFAHTRTTSFLVSFWPSPISGQYLLFSLNWHGFYQFKLESAAETAAVNRFHCHSSL